MLLRNQGRLKFEIVNERAGLPDDIYGLGLAIVDLNRDGYPDFFIAQSNRLFLSRGNSRYREADELREVFAWQPVNGEDVSCGAAFGDMDRDGDLDLVVTNHFSPARNRVYLNTGVKDGIPHFCDVTEEAGLAAPVPTKCPHVEIADVDNDGWMDIYMSAVFVTGEQVTPLIYRNLGVRDGMPRFAAPAFEQSMNYFPAAPTADYDSDGDLDLAFISFFPEFPSRLLRNETSALCPRRHWLQVQVTGTRMNRMGIGAVVRVYRVGSLGQANALLGMQEVATSYGYSSGQPALCHFGLGEAPTCDVEIEFPRRGHTRRLRGVTADRMLKVTEE